MKSDCGKAARAVVGLQFCELGCGKILRDGSNVCKECYELGKKTLEERQRQGDTAVEAEQRQLDADGS